MGVRSHTCVLAHGSDGDSAHCCDWCCPCDRIRMRNNAAKVCCIVKQIGVGIRCAAVPPIVITIVNDFTKNMINVGH